MSRTIVVAGVLLGFAATAPGVVDAADKPGVRDRPSSASGDSRSSHVAVLKSGEFAVNAYTTGEQTYASVAALPDDGFVIVWYGPSALGSDEISGRRFDALNTPIGTDFAVNEFTTGRQRIASVTQTAEGFVVAWSVQQGSVFGRVFDDTGAPTSSEFRIPTSTNTYQRWQSVAADPGGNFVVIWSDDYTVAGRLFDGAGQPLADQFQVSTGTTSQYIRAPHAVARARNGEFVAVWQDYWLDVGYTLSGRRFDETGAPIGEFQVGDDSPQYRRKASVDIFQNNNFAVVWEQWPQAQQDTVVLAQLFDAGNQPIGQSFQVSRVGTPSGAYGAIAADQSGHFLVAWSGYAEDTPSVETSTEVFGRIYSYSGTPLTPEFVINSYTTGGQWRPVVTATGPGEFVVAWNSDGNSLIPGQDGDDSGIFGRRVCVDEDGNAVCDAEQILCSAAPLSDCLTAERSRILVRRTADDTRRQVKFTLRKGDAYEADDLGDPADLTSYTLCLYDSVAGRYQLSAGLIIEPSESWNNQGDAGWSYNDKVGTQDGVQVLRLRAGGAGQSTVRLKARGASAPIPTPVGASTYFSQQPGVTAQLVRREGRVTSACWTSEFLTAKKSDGTQFKAKTP